MSRLDAGPAASSDPPELILAPTAGAAPSADAVPFESAPAAESDAGEHPGQPLPHPDSWAARDPAVGFAAWPAGDEPGTGMPAGIRYRSALNPLLPAPLRRTAQAVRAGAAPQPGADGLVAERVPVSLASAFSALHGTDVSGVPVRRGRAVSRQAARLDAAAFSQDGVVYLPDSAGSLGQATAQALLAHELTHAVQQRMLGNALPGEDSAAGRAFEEQAVATQGWFLGAAGPVPALTLPPSGTAAQLTHPAVARPSPAAEASWGSEAAGERGVQRQPASAPVLANPYSVLQSAPDAPATAVGAAPAGSPDASTSAPIADAHAANLSSQVADLAGQRAAALDDPVELDELAAKLYRRLRTMLRLELIVDRERAGLLTDFR